MLGEYRRSSLRCLSAFQLDNPQSFCQFGLHFVLKPALAECNYSPVIWLHPANVQKQKYQYQLMSSLAWSVASQMINRVHTVHMDTFVSRVPDRICSEGDGIQRRFSKYHVKYIGDKRLKEHSLCVGLQLGLQQNVKSCIRHQAARWCQSRFSKPWKLLAHVL